MKKLPVLLPLFLFASLPSYAQLTQPPGPEEIALMEAAFNGRTALLCASSGPYPETVEYLLKNGADVNTQGTAEGFARQSGHSSVITLLESPPAVQPGS